MASILQSIKISAAIAATGSGVLYTCPANSYAIVNLHTSGVTNVRIGGQTAFNPAGASDVFGVYVGPSQTIEQVSGSSIAVTGVEFINTT